MRLRPSQCVHRFQNNTIRHYPDMTFVGKKVYLSAAIDPPSLSTQTKLIVHASQCIAIPFPSSYEMTLYDIVVIPAAA